MRYETKQAIEAKYQEVENLEMEIDNLLLAEIEQIARHILSTHDRLDEFVMAMGVAVFTVHPGREIPKDSSSYNTGGKRSYQADIEDYAYMSELNDIIEEYNVAGYPMRFTATGSINKNW